MECLLHCIRTLYEYQYNAQSIIRLSADPVINGLYIPIETQKKNKIINGKCAVKVGSIYDGLQELIKQTDTG